MCSLFPSLSRLIYQIKSQKYYCRNNLNNLVQPIAFVTVLLHYMPINSCSQTKLHLVGDISLSFPSISLSYMMGYSCSTWLFPQKGTFLWSEKFHCVYHLPCPSCPQSYCGHTSFLTRESFWAYQELKFGDLLEMAL